MKAKPKLEQSTQKERIRAALNAHWHASAVGDANAEQDIYDEDAIVTIPSWASESLGKAICKPCGVIILASRPGSRSSAFSETGSLSGGIYTHLPLPRLLPKLRRP